MRQVAELMLNLGQTAKNMNQFDQALQFFNQAFDYLSTLQAMSDAEYEEPVKKKPLSNRECAREH